ncbi:MAG: hypothetical protein ACRDH9_09550 [Actinomycetota bacterium]
MPLGVQSRHLRMVERAPTSTSTDPRARPESALDSRLAALANALGRTLRDLRDRLDSVENRLADLPERTSQATTDLRAVLTHLEFIRRQVAEPAGDAARQVDILGERVSMLPEELAARMDETAQGIRRSFEALPPAFAETLEPLKGIPAQLESLEALRDLPGRIQEALGAVGEIRNRVVALEGGIERTREETATAISGLADSVSDRVEGIAGRLTTIISERVAEVARRLEEAISQVREATQDRSAFDEQIANLAEQVVDPREIADAARNATESALSAFTDDYAKRSAALEKAFRRVDDLAEALGSLEKRRGARELLDGEQRLLEQQEAISKRVTETADLLTERIGIIEGELSTILERVDQKRLTEEIAGRIESSVNELRETMSLDLGKRLAQAIAHISKAAADRVAEDIGGRIENLREELAEEAIKAGTRIFMKAGSGLQEEIGAMRAKIDSWGKSRTAPKVAEQIQAMEKRIEKVAFTVEEELVDAVFDRMQRAFDRRFEVLVQLVEARIREAFEKHDETPPAHRRRFMRRPEEE